MAKTISTRQSTKANELALDLSHLKPGTRVAVGLSGGADSVALLFALVESSATRGLVVSAAHLHHGLRGAEADADAEFCRALAEQLNIHFHTERVDVAVAASEKRQSIEEAARELRYRWFNELLASNHADLIATAHTLDDQAETVLQKLLRGAWTEGLSGIHPTLALPSGLIIRPMLSVRRSEVEAFLNACHRPWREDSSNAELIYSRNRIRHQLLPELEKWNPQLKTKLAQMAELAREEELVWSELVEREATWAIQEGRPVRGGGRGESTTGLALDIERMQTHAVAMQRRLFRLAAQRMGITLDFDTTEKLRRLALNGRTGEKLEAAGGLCAERTARELRFSIVATKSKTDSAEAPIDFQIPGTVSGFGIELTATSASLSGLATLRNWKPGDRVRLRYSSSDKKIKEVLERMQLKASDRALWPVVELNGRIVWMKGVEVDPLPDLKFTLTQ